MKASELRIMNLVLDEYLEPVFLVGILPHKMIVSKNGDWDEDCKDLTYSDIEPIPLTEEWLLKFKAIECFGNSEKSFEIGKYKLFINSLGEVNFCFFELGDWYKHIEFVHELQNLYFALTGEELPT